MPDRSAIPDLGGAPERGAAIDRSAIPDPGGARERGAATDRGAVPDPSRLPQRGGDDGGLLLRRWEPDDAEILTEAVLGSIEHLRPWMSWIADEPLTVAQRRALIERWQREWSGGGDVLMGAFLAGEVVGAGGLHRRIGPAGLEIGYWICHDRLRRGLATRVASLLTTLGFSVPGITTIKIHHDRANQASAGVARKLGFTLVAQEADEPQAPAEEGVECRWRMEPGRWAARAS